MKNILILSLLLSLSHISWAQPQVFIENKGQWLPQAKFRMNFSAGYAFLEEDAITYKLFHPEAMPQHAHAAVHQHATRQAKPEVIGHVLRAHFLNSLPTTPQGKQASSTYFNFYTGSQNEWASHANGYEKVHYPSIYPNVDMEVYMHYGHLKYDLIIAPNGKPKDISFTYEGHEGIAIKDGRLQVHTSFTTLEEQIPIAYQYIDGKRVEVPARFKLNNGVVSFEFPQGYNKKHALIIDPELVFSTYSSSSQDNWGFTATYDAEGNTYTAGLTRGDGQFPTTTGAFRLDPISDPLTPTLADIGILKFNAEGSQLIYATYLGGSSTDLPHSLLVNNQNQLILLGSTGSTDFPTTASAFDRGFNGGAGFVSSVSMEYFNGSDAFISIFNESGSELIGSTFLGGSGNDALEQSGTDMLTRNYGDEFRGDLQVDPDDNIYVATVSASTDFPTTSGVLRPQNSGGQDGIICSLNSNASQLRWSTYFGGEGHDGIYSIKFTDLGYLAICGGTTSNTLPTTPNALHRSLQGDVDGFVTALTANGRQLIGSTYLGTTVYDQAYLLDLDENHNIVVFGQTLGNYPVSSNELFSNPNSGQFIHKLTPDLSSTIFSTVFGSGGDGRGERTVNIRPTAFSVSTCGDIMLAGWGGPIRNTNISSSTVNMPTTPDNIPITRETSTGDDFYLMVLSADAKELLYGAFIGGDNPTTNMDHVDGGTSRFDKNGVMYQAACVCRDNNFPASAGAYANSNPTNSGCNNVVFKFNLNNISAQVNPNTFDEDAGTFLPGNEGCPPLEVVFTPENIEGDDLQWDFGDGSTAQQGAPNTISHTYTEPGTYQVTLRSVDPASCQKEAVAVGTITVYETNFGINSSVEICQGDSASLEALGAISYQWLQESTISNPTIPNPLAFPSETTNYQVVLEDARGCIDTLATTVAVTEGLVSLDSNFIEACDTLPRLNITSTISPSPVNASWTLNGNAITASNSGQFVFEPDSAGDYTFAVTLQNNGCLFTDTLDVSIAYNAIGLAFRDAVLDDIEPLCQGDTATLNITEGFIYDWSPSVGLSNTNTSTVQAFPSETTQYVVTISNGLPNCIERRLAEVQVFPEINFDIGYSFIYECGAYPKIAFDNQSTGPSEYEWLWNGITFDTATAPLPYLPAQAGTQEVFVNASNLKCSSDTSFSITIPEIVLPPNVITPNGDGRNDTFQVAGISGWNVQIFNRWGRLVFESDDYQNDWGGEDNTGETFYYLLTAPDGTECKGWVQVLGSD